MFNRVPSSHEPKLNNELKLLHSCVSRADTKPLVMCTLYCVTQLYASHSYHKANNLAVNYTSSALSTRNH